MGFTEAELARIHGPIGLLIGAVSPAEIAVSVISGLAVFVWLTNAAWLPVVLFPMLIAQLTLDYLAASDRKAREMEHLALHDPLTGLPNRTALQRDLTLALAVQQTGCPRAALLMLDLNGFKEVNDTFGQLHGDALLREVALRFKDCVGPRGGVSRLGGDEFAVLFPATAAEDTRPLADRLRVGVASECKRPDGEPIQIRFAVSELEHSEGPEALVELAGLAMTGAKMGEHRATL